MTDIPSILLAGFCGIAFGILYFAWLGRSVALLHTPRASTAGFALGMTCRLGAALAAAAVMIATFPGLPSIIAACAGFLLARIVSVRMMARHPGPRHAGGACED